MGATEVAMAEELMVEVTFCCACAISSCSLSLSLSLALSRARVLSLSLLSIPGHTRGLVFDSLTYPQTLNPNP
jgi:hypothetical protein